MGPREKALRDGAAESFPPNGSAYLADRDTKYALREAQLLDGLEEALDGWEAASQFKGDYLAAPHAIARLRRLLNEAE